jgi:hypothetical protein
MLRNTTAIFKRMDLDVTVEFTASDLVGREEGVRRQLTETDGNVSSVEAVMSRRSHNT